MLKFLRKLVVFLVCAAGLAVLVSFALPSSWEVAREIQIHGHSGEVHQIVGDLHAWKQWSPWGQLVDPDVAVNVGSPSQGSGATVVWTGPKVGDGSAKISFEERTKGVWFDIERRNSRERIKGTFQYQELLGGSTMVKWTLRCEIGLDPVGRYLGLVRIYTTGPDMMDALGRLKRMVERTP